MAERLLLDTCAVIWLSQAAKVSQQAMDAIGRARAPGGSVSVSVMTAWELGMLVSKGRVASTMHPDRWFDEFVDRGRVAVAPVTPVLLVASSYLPGAVHGDPVDRIIIATAREHGLTIVTRDRAILDYGAAGHVRVLAC
ncbi:type II toxin-antitoxin system VapC family toxin [Jiella sp. M17.18]|uniref:type II toxin-antitoxin system VapC family toxin n=1 Tax=Jiella sp. M17.18 TaxID=3234247 RepID=UPI0034DFB145